MTDLSAEVAELEDQVDSSKQKSDVKLCYYFVNFVKTL